MKYISILILGLFLISCENELDLLEDRVEIPIVYALLDAAQENQYFRIERAFADPTISANVIAENPDSLYFKDLTVEIIHIESGDRFQMEEIIGEDEGLPRKEGIFATVPNILYKIPTSTLDLVEGDTYRLLISGVEGEKVFTSDVQIITQPFFALPIEGNPIRIVTDRNLSFSWNAPSNSLISGYTFQMTTHYTETKDGETTDESHKWTVKRNIDEINIDGVSGAAYFINLGDNLVKDPNIERSFDKITIELISGDQYISDYFRAGEANLGVTSSGEIPVYTNIEGGRGIFASTYTITKKNMTLHQDSFDELIDGDITRELNFK